MEKARAGEWRNASGERPDDVPAGGEIGGVGERSVAGAPLELALLCRHRRQTASFCSHFVLKRRLLSQ